MVQTAIQNRVGILLNLLGEDTSSALLAQLPAAEAGVLKSILNELETYPPSEDEIEDVIEEFQRSLALVADDFPADDAPGTEVEEVLAEASGDPVSDLQSLSPSQLATVLETENPRAAAVILGCVDAEVAAQTLGQLPQQIAEGVFLHSQSPPVLTDSVRRLLLENTFERARTIPKEKPVDADEAAIGRLAEMLRKMDRDTRSVMLGRLREADAETAELVADKLYVFEDLLFVSDRSVQGLLAELNSSTLATALSAAEEPIAERVLSNMSKRARASLLEEIEFLGSVSNEEMELATGQICKAMAAMDEKGELEVTEA